MNITIAKYAGACFGVNRSLEMLQSAIAENKKVATLGDIIHNPQTVERLKKENGVIVAKNPSEASENNCDTLVIRSHGALIPDEKKATQLGLNIVDATCPHVKHVQKTAADLAQKYGAVLVIGRAGHPEVEGVLSYIKNQNSKGFVAYNEDEVEQIIPQLQKYTDGFGVVCQTTQSQDLFDQIICVLNENNLSFEVENTICDATKKRQNSALEAAKTADIVIVLGGLNSSNTTHLKEICQKVCKSVYHIQDENDVSGISFKDAENVVICAGASTPKSQIQSLIQNLKYLE